MRRPLRPAEQFAAAVDGSSVGSPRDTALSPLLALAQQLQALPLGPTPAFRDALRTRLMAVAAVSAPLGAAPTTVDRARATISGWRVQRGLAAATAGMAAVVGITGISTAGVRSLPGDPFYTVKRGTENVQLALTRGEEARGKRHLAQAESRLDEVGELVGDPSAAAALGAGSTSVSTYAFGGSTSSLIRDTLADMDEATSTGTRLLTEAYADDRDDTGPLKALASFVRRQKSGLADVIPALPAGAQKAGAASLALIADVEMRANALLTNGLCGEDCAPAPAVDASAAPLATPAPAPQPTPDATADLGPEPCNCQAQPTPQPAPQPTRQPQPAPSRTPSPQPSPSTSPSEEPRLSDIVPSAVPAPVRSPLVEVIDTIEDLLPTLVPAPAPVPVPVPAPAPKEPAMTSAPVEPQPAAGPLALPGS